MHRVGRTARAGKAGRSVSLVGEDDRKVLKLAIKNANDIIKQRVLPLTLVENCNKVIQELGSTIEEILMEEKKDKQVRGHLGDSCQYCNL